MENNPEYKKHLDIIKREIPYVDIKPYSHNIISLELRCISEKFGQKYANKIITDYELDKLGWWVEESERGIPPKPQISAIEDITADTILDNIPQEKKEELIEKLKKTVVFKDIFNDIFNDI